jgi:hypothetical protein
MASHSVDTTINSSSSNSSACGVGQHSQAAASTDAAACMMDLLLPDTIVKILKLLWDSPASIIAFSLTCSQAQQLCSDRNLWTDLCRSITDTLPGSLRSVNWRPVKWELKSHRELYIRLLQPYRPLLQQRVWHTTKMPAGQLLIVDADPPFLHARSVYFRSLQGCPFKHEVFLVKLRPSSIVGSDAPKVGSNAHLQADCSTVAVRAVRVLEVHGFDFVAHGFESELSTVRSHPHRQCWWTVAALRRSATSRTAACMLTAMHRTPAYALCICILHNVR